MIPISVNFSNKRDSRGDTLVPGFFAKVPIHDNMNRIWICFGVVFRVTNAAKYVRDSYCHTCRGEGGSKSVFYDGLRSNTPATLTTFQYGSLGFYKLQ